MARGNYPVQGQIMTKAYATLLAYQRDANKLAAQGWGVQSTTMHDVGGRYQRPEVLATYVYRPGAPIVGPLSVTQPVASPPGALAQMPTAAPVAPEPLYHYPIWEALLVTVLMVVGFALIAAGVGFGTAPFLAGVIWAIVRDGRGLRSMRNLVNWNTMSAGSKAWLILGIFFVFEVFLPIYLVRVVGDSFGFHRQAALSVPLEVKRRTAELESQLGIVPGVEGECRVCHKPLQVNADYCAYCGEPVVQRPRICPVCAATTLPDAKFCPKCRAELPTIA